MPTYQLPNAQTVSEYFSKINMKLKKEFIYYEETNYYPQSLKLVIPEKKLSLLYENIEDVAGMEHALTVDLTKRNVYYNLINDTTLLNLSIVNQDGMFDTLVWTTTPDRLQSALRNGVFPPTAFQNPMVKMIAQLGEYKRIVFKRSVERKIIVKHNAEKLLITDCAQDCLEALLPLFDTINNYDESLPPVENLLALSKKLIQLHNLEMEILNRLPPTSYLHPNLKEKIHQLDAHNQSYQQRLEGFITSHSQPLSEHEIREILKPYASPHLQHNLSLQTFLQEHLDTIIRKAIALNYFVSGFLQDSSQLQKILVKTQVLAEGFSSHKIDYHNPYTPAHALDFHNEGNEKQLVTIDLGNFGFAPWTKAELVEQVALIHRVDHLEPLFKNSDVERGYFGVNWGGNIFAGLTWLQNFIKDITGAILDLVYVTGVKPFTDAVRYLAGKEAQPVEFPSSYRWLLKTDLAERKYAALLVNTGFYQPEPLTKIPHYSILQGVYIGIARIFSRLLIEPLVSISNVVADEVLHFKTAKQVFYDATIGTKPVNETAVTLLVGQRLNETKVNLASNEVTLTALIESYNKIPGHYYVVSYKDIAAQLNQRKKTQPPVAELPYSLTPDEPIDLVNWLVDDFIRGLIEVFSHNSFRDHPIAGIALTLAASTAAPMILPQLLKNPMFSAINQNVSVPISQYLIGDTTGLMAGISTGILQGQMSFLAVEIFNGRNSIFVNGIKTLLENPVIASVVTMTAVGFGYSLAYEMQIPWLSQFIKSETDQATFPWFELGVAGAKIAAIMVEGTFSLHQEHAHSSDHMVNDAIRKLRPEIEKIVTTGFCDVYELSEHELTDEQREQIDSMVTDYFENVYSALQKPRIATQIKQLSAAIAVVLGRDLPVDVNGQEVAATDPTSQNALLMFLERRELRHQIAQLNPHMLTTRDKYIIVNYVTQMYPNDPDYVAAVRTHFYNERKIGSLGETFKIISNYPSAIIRSTVASGSSLIYEAYAFYYKLRGNQDKANAMREMAHRAWQPLRDFGRKIKNDSGLLVKGIAAVLRITWGLLGAILMMPVTLLLTIPIMPFIYNAPIKIFSSFNKIVFAPGRISQFINTTVALLRADSGAKNLSLASQDMDARYSRLALIPDAALPAVSRAGSLTAVAPVLPSTRLTGGALEVKVLDLITLAFNTQSTLRRFVNPPPVSLDLLLKSLMREILKQEQVDNLYAMLRHGKPLFNSELKAALLTVTNEIKQLTDVNYEEKLVYQKKFIDLFKMNQREPIAELVQAYAAFINFTLPEAVRYDHNNILTALAAAQTNLKSLATHLDGSKSSQQLVIECLQKHDCLSLQSMGEIEKLKRTLASTRFISTEHKKTSGELLRAFELIHNSAQTAAFRLAAYPAIVNMLTRLPVEPALATVDKSPTSANRSPFIASLATPAAAGASQQTAEPREYKQNVM
jgi:hypothetical protein